MDSFLSLLSTNFTEMLTLLVLTVEYTYFIFEEYFLIIASIYFVVIEALFKVPPASSDISTPILPSSDAEKKTHI